MSPVGLWTTQKRVAHKPHRPNNSKQRTLDVLQNADIFTRYGQRPDSSSWPESVTGTFANDVG